MESARFKCPVDGCQSSYSHERSLKSHVAKKHRTKKKVLRSENSDAQGMHDPVQSVAIVAVEEQKRDEKPGVDFGDIPQESSDFEPSANKQDEPGEMIQEKLGNEE